MNETLQAKDRHEEILDAAAKLFQRFGFLKTTMEDIARAMGKRKSSLYYYYKSKDEIAEALMEREGRDVIQKVKSATDNVESASQKLEAYLITAFEAIQEKITLYELMTIEQRQLGAFFNPSIIEKTSDLNEYSKRIIANIIKKGIVNKEFQEDIEEKLDIISEVIFTSFINVMEMTEITNQVQKQIKRDKLIVFAALIIAGLKK